MSAAPGGDLLCFSHLRWNFVFQRPQHLMTRFAAGRRVFFVEEPVVADETRFEVRREASGVRVIVPHVTAAEAAAPGFGDPARLARLLKQHGVERPVIWAYTPMAIDMIQALPASLVVYDCMDELSGFLGASARLLANEAALLSRADLVFAGGQSLYEAKRERHPRVFAFPSSVDVRHFSGARTPQADPLDQASLPHPRAGYCGVIDERIDLHLLDEVARRRPELHLVMVGPVVKIDPRTLPLRPNIHYLGMKPYAELPAYLAGWDVALLPFALNHATRFISPTKTPEYLAAGLPVVSTPVADVVRPYGDMGLVEIAHASLTFAQAIDRSLGPRPPGWLPAVDRFLAGTSWDETWSAMAGLIDDELRLRRPASVPLTAGTVLQPEAAPARADLRS